MAEYRLVISLLVQEYSYRQIEAMASCSHRTIAKARKAMDKRVLTTLEQIEGLGAEDLAELFAAGRKAASELFIDVGFEAVVGARIGRKKPPLKVLWARYLDTPAPAGVSTTATNGSARSWRGTCRSPSQGFTPITGPTRVWVTTHPRSMLAGLSASAVLDAGLGEGHWNREVERMLRAGGATGPVTHATRPGQRSWSLDPQLRQSMLQPVPAGPCRLWIRSFPGQGLRVAFERLYGTEHSEVLVTDATPACPLGPAPDRPGDWNTDRERWFSWAGLRMDEVRDLQEHRVFGLGYCGLVDDSVPVTTGRTR